MTFTTSTFLTRVLPSGVCWICYDDHVDRLFVIILTLQLKPVCLLFLRSVAILYSSFQCLCATTVLSFQISKKIILKYLKNCCLSSFKRPNTVWNSPSSSLARNTLWIQYFRFSFFAFLLLQEGKAQKQWSHSSHNDPYLRLQIVVAAHYKT